MTKLVNRFINDEAGSTAIEYGLIASLVAVAIIAAVGQVGTGLRETFEGVADELN